MKRNLAIRSLAAMLLAASILGSGAVAAQPLAGGSGSRTPVVIFPAFHFTRLIVEIDHQTAVPGCPASGTFEDWFLNDVPTTVSQVCQDELLTLVYDPDPSEPLPRRFSEQPGVTVRIADYGKTASAPFYEPLYAFLESHGY